MNKIAAAVALLPLAAACSKQQQPTPQEQHATRLQTSAPIAASTPIRRVLGVDPKSTAAAEQLVRGFATLLTDGRFDQAYMLLGPNAPPRSAFDREFGGMRNVHVTLGAAGPQEGAAGSSYVSVPLTIAGTSGGKRISRSATAVLRRVNDVPGSTEAQRRWHIERIDWSNPV